VDLWAKRRMTCALVLFVGWAAFMFMARLRYEASTPEDARGLRPLGEEPSISWGDTVNGLALGLSCSGQELQVDGTAEFAIYLKNEGEAPWHIPGLFVGLEIPAIGVYDAVGQEVRFRHVVLEIDIGSGQIIQPGHVMSTTQSIALSNKGWEGGVGSHRAKAVYDTRALEWGARQDLNASPMDYWVGICQSGDVLFNVEAERSSTAWPRTLLCSTSELSPARRPSHAGGNESLGGTKL
jgi:hypothetical protein